MGARRFARGLSLVGLLVGTAIGLLAVAAAGAMASAHVHESRRLLDEARLGQDLRMAIDVVARDLRRAGHWGASASGLRDDGGPAAFANPYSQVASAPGGSDGLLFRFSRDAVENQVVDSHEHAGFRLRSGVIESQLGENNWQALTDVGTLVVTALVVEPRSDEIDLARFCTAACAPGSASCPPRQLVRSVGFSISARSARDPRVSRTVRGSARLRNDVVVGNCEG